MASCSDADFQRILKDELPKIDALKKVGKISDPKTLRIVIDDEQTPYRKQCRMRRSALIQRIGVYRAVA